MSLRIRQRSNLRSLFDAGQWQFSLIERARKQAQISRRTSDWITYLDICLTLRGMAPDDCRDLMEQCKTSHGMSVKLRFKLCNTLFTGSTGSQAAPSDRQALYEELLGEKNPGFVSAAKDILSSGYLGSSLSHYPALLTDSTGPLATGMRVNWKEKDYRRMAMKLKDSTISLQDGLRQILDLGDRFRHDSIGQSATVAVVGNSPDLLGQEKGEEIDSHDLVVRFNKISAETAQQAHTGKRTDIWVMSPSTSIEHCPPDAKMVVVSGLHALTRPSFYWRNLPMMGKPLAEFDASVWYELVQRFEAPPSAGTLAIAALRAGRQKMKIHHFGFTTTQGIHGSSPNHHNDQAQVSSRHNWQAEVSWLRDSVS